MFLCFLSVETQPRHRLVGRGHRDNIFRTSYNKIFDAMDGLNVGHAMWRAREHWPDAVVTLRYAASRTVPNVAKVDTNDSRH